MQTCKLSVHNQAGACLAETERSPYPILVYGGAYAPGDYIRLDAGPDGGFFEIRLEDSMPPAIVYLSGDSLRFPVPFGAQRIPYSPKSFEGALHMIAARPAEETAVYGRRNLSLNPYDGSDLEGVYPHASANIETRGEAVFAARNTIDGIFANASHGEYPFQSWGINRDPDAALKIDLGVPCRIDEVRLTLRADFPHDNYWVRAALVFSDQSTETVELVKTPLPQTFRFPAKEVRWVELCRLIPSDEPSPFPALTQIELWGNVIQSTVKNI